LSTRWYILDGKIAKETPMLKAAKWMETANRIVALTELLNGVRVSTVFLCLDHGMYGKGPPILFETMIFGGSFDQDYQERCSTWEQAEEMHRRAVYMAMERHEDEISRPNHT